MTPPVYVHCGFGLLLVLASIPLVLRKVPMNPAYGIRIPAAFRSERNWYAINAFGGKLFLAYGLLLLLFGFIFRNDAPPDASLASPFFVAGPLALALTLIIPIMIYARRLR